MTEIFITAQAARAQALEQPVYLNEVNAIQIAILTAVQAGALTCVILTSPLTTPSGGSPATAEAYYSVFAGLTVDRSKSATMDAVIQYFTDLSYSIVRQVNTSTNNTFTWNLSW
jgi:hypothetical protein